MGQNSTGLILSKCEVGKYGETLNKTLTSMQWMNECKGSKTQLTCILLLDIWQFWSSGYGKTDARFNGCFSKAMEAASPNLICGTDPSKFRADGRPENPKKCGGHNLPPGWNRVNWPARIWDSRCPPAPLPRSLRPSFLRVHHHWVWEPFS